MRLMTLGLCFALAACGGKTASTTATVTKPADAAVEFGEMTLWDGEEAAMKVHADGTTEVGFRSGRLELQGGHASSDQLPLRLKPGPTITADGTIAIKNEPKLRINADGTITDLRDNTPFPIAVTPDKVTITNGDRQFGFELAATGEVTVFGGMNPTTKPLRIEGADTPGKRRTMLAFISLSFLPAQPGPPIEGASTSAPPR
jgi:hypothetical protein